MAAATYTYNINMSATPKGNHVGDNILPWNINVGTAVIGTISDVVLLGKIPNGALILDKSIRFGAVAGVTAQSWALTLLVPEVGGTLSQYAVLISSMSASTGAVTFRDVQPYKLSMSDDRALQYAILALNCTTGTSATVSFSTQGFVTFTSDGGNV